MKTRYGFVSNSSTTSFCIYGVRIDPETLRNWKKRPRVQELLADHDSTDVGDLLFMLHQETGSDRHSLSFEAGESYYGDNDGPFYMGLDFGSMYMHETKQQFEHRILLEIKLTLKALGLSPEEIQEAIGDEAHIYMEAWRDG